MMVGVGVVAIALEHRRKDAASVGEAAELEERHAALVLRIEIARSVGQRALQARQRFFCAAEIVERLALEQRETRGLRLAAIGLQPLDVAGAAARVLETNLG